MKESYRYLGWWATANSQSHSEGPPEGIGRWTVSFTGRGWWWYSAKFLCCVGAIRVSGENTDGFSGERLRIADLHQQSRRFPLNLRPDSSLNAPGCPDELQVVSGPTSEDLPDHALRLTEGTVNPLHSARPSESECDQATGDRRSNDHPGDRSLLSVNRLCHRLLTCLAST